MNRDVSILYGLDSGPRDENFPTGQQVTIEVAPFRTHLLQSLMVSVGTRRCVAPERLVVGIDRHNQDCYELRGREQAGFALRYEDAKGAARIVLEEGPVVVMRNEMVAVTFLVVEPIHRIVATAIGDQPPSTVARDALFAELQSIDATFSGEPKPPLHYAAKLNKVSGLWQRCAGEIRLLEALRAEQRGVKPLDDEQLGLGPGPFHDPVPDAGELGEADPAAKLPGS